VSDSNQSLRSVAMPLATIAILALAFIIWLFLPPVKRMLTAVTPTPQPSLTPRPTRTPRPSATPTLTPEPSPTAQANPADTLQNLKSIDPPLLAPAVEVIVLNEDKNVQVDPDFTNLQWISSTTIATQLAQEIPEPYYATFGPASVIWRTDRPVSSGLYQIYVMDTVYSSAGPLDFKVALDDTVLSPSLGQTHIDFQTNRFDPRQVVDKWRDIGTYRVDRSGILSVSTSWQSRNEDSIVAIDRVLILHLPDPGMTVLDRLPPAGLRYIIDEIAATKEKMGLSLTRTDVLAWGGSYEVVINPTEDCRVTWETSETVPPGQFQIAMWVPANKNQPVVNFRVLADDTELEPGPFSGALTSGNPEGGWISLGTWSTPRVMEKPVRLKVQMSIPAGTTGEIPVDAVAFMRIP